MLRYHLGTGFENVFIPAAGETDAQLGNTIPNQGFVEITIKDMENMLHVEVSKLWSKGLIECYTDSRAQFDLESNSLTKQGLHLKLNDQILRRVDPCGELSNKYFSWKIADFTHAKPLQADGLVVGREYGVFIGTKKKIMPFALATLDTKAGAYNFKSLSTSVANLKATAETWPLIYENGVEKDGEVRSIVLESVQKMSGGGFMREELPMNEVKTVRFTLDVGHTHVVECIGYVSGSHGALRCLWSWNTGLTLLVAACQHFMRTGNRKPRRSTPTQQPPSPTVSAASKGSRSPWVCTTSERSAGDLVCWTTSARRMIRTPGSWVTSRRSSISPRWRRGWCV